MREELKTICMFLVYLPEYERKQIMSVLLASTLNDLSNDKAKQIYESTKEGMSVKYLNEIKSIFKEITSKVK